MLRNGSDRRRLFALAVTAAMLAGLSPLASPTRVAAAVLASPTLTSPGSGSTVTGNPVFAWTAVSSAIKYRIEISVSPTFAPTVVADETQNLRYTPTTELPLGTLYWRVAARDTGNVLGTYASSSFTKGWGAAPNQLTPADGATLSFPTDPLLFTWGALTGAQSYELQVDDADDFIGATTYNTKNTAYVITEPRTVGQTFYWRVRGASGSIYSDWSPSWDFRSVWPTKPVLVYPKPDDPTDDTDLVTDVYFDWEPVLGAETYQLQVSPNADWTNNKTIDVTVKSTRYAPPVPLNNGNYFWRVRALDAASTANFGPWSDSEGVQRVFQRGWPDKPSLVWPPDGGSTADQNLADPTWQNPTFTWTPARRASWYRIRIGTAKNGVTGLLDGMIQGCITNRTTLTPWVTSGRGPCYFSLVAGTTYYWDVAGIDNPVLNASAADLWGPPDQKANVIGLRSDVRSFVWQPPAPLPGTIQPLDPNSDYLTPIACAPQDNCTKYETDTSVLTWTAIPGASAYRVTVSLDPNFTNIYATYCTDFNRLAATGSWRDNQASEAYYWNVTPDVNCSAPPTLDPANYSVFQKRSVPVYRTAPVQNDVLANDFELTWQHYVDTNLAFSNPPIQRPTQEARQYRITVSTVSDLATTIETKVVNTPFYTPYDKTYPEGPIYWRVQAIDGSDNDLTWSTVGLVTKTSPPPSQFFPGNAATVTGVPYLQWLPLAYAASYDLQLDNDDNFSSPITTTTTKMTAWAYTEPLAAGTYYWRVRRNDADSRDGQWSQVWSFVLAPAAPTLISPANGSNPSPTTLLLQWTSTQPAPKYAVDLSTSSSFASYVSGYPVTTVMTSWAPDTLLVNGTYYWRVKALNASGTAVATSATFSFTIDSTRPSVTSLSPASAAAITSPFTVTFSESVSGVSGGSFVVTVAGTSTAVPGTVAVLSSTSARFTPASLLVPGQTYAVALSTAITDSVGNPLLPYSANVRTSTTVQQDSPAVREAWGRWSTRSASGGAMKIARTASTSLTLRFTGSSIRLVGYRGPSGGYASIYLDGVLQTSGLSFYASANQYRRTLWSKAGLVAGPHTLQVLPRGTKRSASKGTWVYVDAFVVDGMTIQENSAAVTDRFRRTSTTSASGSSYDRTSHIATTGRSGPSLTLQFKGTGISWYGTKGTTYGKAYVYIDNIKKTTIDLYRSGTAYRQRLWTSATLSNGLHTIRILVVGTKRSAAKGYDVSFDYFAIK